MQLIVADVQNKYILTTFNYGENFTSTQVQFAPEQLLFDPIDASNIIAYEESTDEKQVCLECQFALQINIYVYRGEYFLQMWVSQDYGKTWSKVQEHVKTVAWDKSVFPPKLFIQREQPSGKSIIISSGSLFMDPANSSAVLMNVDGFQIKDNYKFATWKNTNVHCICALYF